MEKKNKKSNSIRRIENKKEFNGGKVATLINYFEHLISGSKLLKRTNTKLMSKKGTNNTEHVKNTNNKKSIIDYAITHVYNEVSYRYNIYSKQCFNHYGIINMKNWIAFFNDIFFGVLETPKQTESQENFLNNRDKNGNENTIIKAT